MKTVFTIKILMVLLLGWGSLSSHADTDTGIRMKRIHDNNCERYSGGPSNGGAAGRISCANIAFQEVTITNATKGQPIAGLVVLARLGQVFKVGKEASPGLKLLSQEGETGKFMREVRNASALYVAEGVLMPGKSVKITMKMGGSLSVYGMLARTNDAFIHYRNHLIPRYLYNDPVQVYDSGVEQNTELCQHIPAPPCNSPGVGTDGGEGFVHFHPGFFNIGDLDPLRDAFDPKKVALISIESYDSGFGYEDHDFVD